MWVKALARDATVALHPAEDRIDLVRRLENVGQRERPEAVRLGVCASLLGDRAPGTQGEAGGIGAEPNGQRVVLDADVKTEAALVKRLRRCQLVDPEGDDVDRCVPAVAPSV